MDHANVIFLLDYISIIIILNKNSHLQPKKGYFTLDKNSVAQNIETSHFFCRLGCMIKIFILFIMYLVPKWLLII